MTRSYTIRCCLAQPNVQPHPPLCFQLITIFIAEEVVLISIPFCEALFAAVTPLNLGTEKHTKQYTYEHLDKLHQESDFSECITTWNRPFI